MTVVCMYTCRKLKIDKRRLRLFLERLHIKHGLPGMASRLGSVENSLFLELLI